MELSSADTQRKELDYAELLREKLVFIKERLEYLEVILPHPELVEATKTCLDYTFYLKDETLTKFPAIVMAERNDAEFLAGRVITADEWQAIQEEIQDNEILWNKVNTALKKAVKDVII